MAFLQKRLASQANERPPETKPTDARGLADALARSLGRESARAADQS